MKDKEKVGFVAVYRKIQDHWIWDDPERFHAWLDILMSAQFADSETIVKGKLVKVPRGTWFISLRKLEKRWGWSRPKVSLFLSMLESEQMINIKKTGLGTFIKVLNYEVYQNTDGKKKTADMHTDVHTDITTDMHADMQHKNKGNKNNKGNKIDETFLSKCTYTKEEGDNYSRMVKAGEKPFPNAATEDEYWKRELEERRKDW